MSQNIFYASNNLQNFHKTEDLRHKLMFIQKQKNFFSYSNSMKRKMLINDYLTKTVKKKINQIK